MRVLVGKLLAPLLLAVAVSLCGWALSFPKELFAARLASPEPGTTSSLGDARGKAIVVLVAGRKSYPAAYEQAVRLTREWNSNDQAVAVVVADLGGVPGFVRGAAEEALVKSHKSANERLPAGTRVTTLLDWEGLFARQLDVVGESNDGYLLYVVDRRGQVLLRLAQNVNDITEDQVFRAVLGSLQRSR
jgi:hypothetical protein